MDLSRSDGLGRPEAQGVDTPRIVFLNRFFYPDLSATSQMLSDLAFGLAERGAEIHIITSRLRYDDAAARLPAAEIVKGVKVHRVWTSGFGRSTRWGRAIDYISFYVSAFRACLHVLRRGDILVAKTDPPMISVIGAIATRLRGAKLVNWLQDLFPEVAAAANIRFAQGRSGHILRKIRDWSLRRAVTTVAIGHRMRDRLVERGLDPARIAIIENWAGDELHPIPHKSNSLRQQWGLDGYFVVGYSGNMGEAHEFDTILAAAEQLCDCDHIRFLFIGGGKHRPYIEQAIRERHLHNIDMRAYQPRERLSESLSTADVHLICLRPEFEGLIVPSKFYGISAVGRPCLHIGDVDGELKREIAPESRLRIGDSEGLAERIQDLARRPKECEYLGELSRKRFLTQQSLAHSIERWADVLDLSSTSMETRRPTLHESRLLAPIAAGHRSRK